VNETELHQFYLQFVSRLRDRGLLCAITGDLACLEYGISESPLTCDLLCHPLHFDALLEELAATTVAGRPCYYRGNLSPPLDDRWHSGGWTSHFNWGRGPDAVTLDVFGRALRAVESWEAELSGLYVNPHIVAQMKRTDRDKDWPFINALGVTLLEGGDLRGWLHLYDPQDLARFQDVHPCPDEILALRPALRLARQQDKRLAGALSAERKLWEELDRIRIQIYQRALRPYLVAVRKRQLPDTSSLHEQHQVRLECAADHLVAGPLKEYGVHRHIEEARRALVESGQIPAAALDWLPDVTEHFHYLDH
jgi:hypothetical protein